MLDLLGGDTSPEAASIQFVVSRKDYARLQAARNVLRWPQNDKPEAEECAMEFAT